MTHLTSSTIDDRNLTSTISSNTHSSIQTKLNWPILLLFIPAVFGTIGNLLVCASITLDRQLQTVTNWFLFSLAIADCLVCLIVIPFSILQDFQGQWNLSVILCNVHVFFDVLLCTTSIWHLTILSIDRFRHISRPFRSRDRSKCKTFSIILSIWTCSIVISCVIFILGLINESHILYNDNNKFKFCTLNNSSFIICGSIICFCVPCILMIVTYSLTIRRLRQQIAKYGFDHDGHVAQTKNPSSRLRRHRLNSKVRSPSSNSHQLTTQKDVTNSTPMLTPSSSRTPTLLEVDSVQNHLEWSIPSQPPSPTPSLQRSFVQRAVHALKKRTEVTGEQRAMKILGIVFSVFLIAWLPFSILNILHVIMPNSIVRKSLLRLTVWLGYMSSIINPIIYTAFNVRFRRAFFSILTCQFDYFLRKRKENNLYIFIASNNSQQTIDTDHQQYTFALRRIPSKQNSFN